MACIDACGILQFQSTNIEGQDSSREGDRGRESDHSWLEARLIGCALFCVVWHSFV